MAIIRNILTDGAANSMGKVTFKRTNGRTVASQKRRIASNSTNSQSISVLDQPPAPAPPAPIPQEFWSASVDGVPIPKKQGIPFAFLPGEVFSVQCEKIQHIDVDQFIANLLTEIGGPSKDVLLSEIVENVVTGDFTVSMTLKEQVWINVITYKGIVILIFA
jgi:hypothetical protein